MIRNDRPRVVVTAGEGSPPGDLPTVSVPVVAAAHDGLRPADAATHPAVTAVVRAATHEHLVLRRLARQS